MLQLPLRCTADYSASTFMCSSEEVWYEKKTFGDNWLSLYWKSWNSLNFIKIHHPLNVFKQLMNKRNPVPHLCDPLFTYPLCKWQLWNFICPLGLSFEAGIVTFQKVWYHLPMWNSVIKRWYIWAFYAGTGNWQQLEKGWYGEHWLEHLLHNHQK